MQFSDEFGLVWSHLRILVLEYIHEASQTPSRVCSALIEHIGENYGRNDDLALLNLLRQPIRNTKAPWR
jgi:ethanolamine utilization cobalamin adenosyltransferase